MEDVASGHDNAYVGGATFQQTATEYRMAKLLTSLGYTAVPCLGFGRVEKAGLSSWFAVFEMEDDWFAIKPPRFSLEHYCESKVAMGELLLDLAVKHDLIGYASFLGTRDGQRCIKDLHPFRMADPVGMSQLSWVMQLFFALHIVSLAAIHFSKQASGKGAGGHSGPVFQADPAEREQGRPRCAARGPGVALHARRAAVLRSTRVGRGSAREPYHPLHAGSLPRQIFPLLTRRVRLGPKADIGARINAMSASPLRADMLSVEHGCPLRATSGHEARTATSA